MLEFSTKGNIIGINKSVMFKQGVVIQLLDEQFIKRSLLSEVGLGYCFIWVIGSWAALLKMGQLNPAQLTIGSWAWPILRWAGWEVGLQHIYTCVSDDSTNRDIKKIFEEGLLNPTRTTTFISQFYFNLLLCSLIPNEALRHLRKSWHFARIVIGVPWYSQLHLSRFTKILLHMADHVHALDANKFMPIAAETTGLFG